MLPCHIFSAPYSYLARVFKLFGIGEAQWLRTNAKGTSAPMFMTGPTFLGKQKTVRSFDAVFLAENISNAAHCQVLITSTRQSVSVQQPVLNFMLRSNTQAQM